MFLGKVEDLKDPIKKGENKARYNCPYCDIVHGKSKDTKACMSFDYLKQVGMCFRCGTIIVSDNLRDLEYIKCILSGNKSLDEFIEANNQKFLMDWTIPVCNDNIACKYMLGRKIYPKTLKRFNVRACESPGNGVVFVNTLEDNITDYFQVRFIEKTYRHLMIAKLKKKLSWIHLADTPYLVICEGFTSGLSAYQHSLTWNKILNPVVISGNTLTNVQLRDLKNFCSKNKEVTIYINLDGGFYEHSIKMASLIYKEVYNSKIFLVNMPFKLDPNEVNSVEYSKLLDEAIEFEPKKISLIRRKAYGNKEFIKNEL